MALENKKSLLQPSSTQAQQSRLQFSNLAPFGVAPASLTNQQNSPVANARPVVSAFLSAPAPVSLQAPPTIPPALPAPVPAPTPVVSDVPIEWSKTAMYFNGENIMSSSLELVDLSTDFTSSNEGLGVMIALRPNSWTPATTSGHAYTLVHFYSGSQASQSLSLNLVDGGMQAVFRNNGQTTTFTETIPLSQVETLGNGYTLLTFNFINRSTWPADFSMFSRINVGSSRLSLPSPWPPQISSSYTDMDHLYIGGTQFEANKNFIGNIAFVAFRRGIFGQSLTAKVVNGTLKPKQLATADAVMTRVYTFHEPIGNALAIETTGSLATKQVPLQFSGSSMVVNPNAISSYFTQ